MLTKSRWSNPTLEEIIKHGFLTSYLPRGSGIHWVKIDTGKKPDIFGKGWLYYVEINYNRYSGNGRPRKSDYDIKKCRYPVGLDSEILYPYDAVKEDYTKIYKKSKNSS